VITRAIGAADTVEPDLFAARLQTGDMLLLASDGLTRYASPGDIVAVASGASDLASVCSQLIEHAKRGGGADNITCILLRAIEAAPGADVETIETGTPAI
jgi:protein phosphatase